MNASIITACIPSLKRFLANLQTGLTALTVTDNMELSFAGKSGVTGRYGSASRGSKLASKVAVSDAHNNNSISGEVVPYAHNLDSRTRHTATVVSGNANKKPKRATLERSSSQEQLREDVISRTVEFKVEYEARSEGSNSVEERVV